MIAGIGFNGKIFTLLSKQFVGITNCGCGCDCDCGLNQLLLPINGNGMVSFISGVGVVD